MIELPSYVWFYLAAAVLALIPDLRLRAAIGLATPVASGVLVVLATPDIQVSATLLGYELTPYRLDPLAQLFVYLFHIAAFLGSLYSLHVPDRVQQCSGLVYAGSAIGAVVSGDLLTLFVFWELMALSSVFLIWARRTPAAIAAGQRYLIIQVLSGTLLFVGAAVHYQHMGSFAFGYVGLDAPGGWLLFLAFGIKCAFPLLHNWLTDGYPEATAAGAVFLTAFTTKAAVYALARGFPGEELLVYIGAAMTAFPIFYAVIENDLRRVLAYSMVNQLGFMVCGVGIGTALALNGAVAHAFNDVIFKGLLFMAMGAVLYRTGHVLGSDLGGLYKTMPKTAALCIVGAASISAFPLFSGFVSKSMVMSALLHQNYDAVWLVLLFASAGVFHHAGIKIPYFAFFAHDSGIRTSDPPLNMLAAMTLAAVLCVAIGVAPGLLYAGLPWETTYTPYDLTHVLTQLQLLFFSALAFVWLNLRGLYPPELRSVNIDAEWLYRKLGPALVDTWNERVVPGLHAATRGVAETASAAAVHARGYVGSYTTRAMVSTSGMLIWATVLLTLFVLLAPA